MPGANVVINAALAATDVRLIGTTPASTKSTTSAHLFSISKSVVPQPIKVGYAASKYCCNLSCITVATGITLMYLLVTAWYLT